MPRILVTAFEPYDRWSDNSSWLTLIEFTKAMDRGVGVTTRLYPVDFAAVQQRLEQDLAGEYDYALHLGQAPGSAHLRLEAIALNVGGDMHDSPADYRPLVAGGPVAYRSGLPLGEWAQLLRRVGIPATVSYHAGTYLCNATLYLSHYFADRNGYHTQSTFIHVPLDTSQAAREHEEVANLPSSISATGLRLIVSQLVRQTPLRDLELA